MSCAIIYYYAIYMSKDKQLVTKNLIIHKCTVKTRVLTYSAMVTYGSWQTPLMMYTACISSADVPRQSRLTHTQRTSTILKANEINTYLIWDSQSVCVYQG